MTNKEARYNLMEYYACEIGCHADDFLSNENKVFHQNKVTRQFFSMYCFGYASVAQVGESMYEWLEQFLTKHIGFRCYDGIQLVEITKQLERCGYSVGCGQGMLPEMEIDHPIHESRFQTALYEKNRLSELLENTDESLLSINDETEFIIAAFDSDNVIATAPAQKRTNSIYEIGIDVLPEYRRNGIATTLTEQITRELLMRGKIPYASTAWSNIASRGVLARCGYIPCDVKMSSMDIEFATRIIRGDYS